jgi:hypothetical protein
MQRLIRKILKEESLKQTLKDQVKEFGWEDAAELVGDGEILARLGFNNDPVEFLNLFNDLDIVQSKEKPYLTLFRYEKGNNMMIYDRKNEYVYINYDVIWSFLGDVFGLKYVEIQELTQEWLSETYNLRGITTKLLVNYFDYQLSEAYNLKI